MYIYIDTANNQSICSLYEKKGELLKTSVEERRNSENQILKQISRVLGSGTLDQIKGIAVNSGPGTFSGIRQGIVTANTLAWKLGIPVKSIKITERTQTESLIEKALRQLRKVTGFKQALPFYNKEPNIT